MLQGPIWGPTIINRPGKGTCLVASVGHRHVAQLSRSLVWKGGHRASATLGLT